MGILAIATVILRWFVFDTTIIRVFTGLILGTLLILVRSELKPRRMFYYFGIVAHGFVFMLFALAIINALYETITTLMQ